MAINWFEGGRRISHLLMGIVGAGGAIHVIWGSTAVILYESASPDEEWRLTTDECRGHTEYIGSQTFRGNDTRSVLLCFTETPRGNIRTAIAPAPTPAPSANSTPAPSISPPAVSVIVPPSPSKWYFENTEYSESGTNYIAARKADFAMTHERVDEAQRKLSEIGRAATWRRFKEALPWVGGFIFGIWIVTSVFGWIIRGFAGIPQGRDFKPDREV